MVNIHKETKEEMRQEIKAVVAEIHEFHDPAG